MLSPTQAEALFEEAQKASESSYSPYSQFPVGAALLLTSGDIIHGCNVENASFGLTICAERSALVSWISQAKQADAIVAIAVYGANTKYHHITPCGACRQSLVEFCGDDTVLVFRDAFGELTQKPVTAFLPDRFEL
ncbi:MAG: cytidine deaminase [Vampirovibrionales bacterium]|jgi:cytidine deaminase|nr:cytidine deaminase [Vampirovibrionales bacterium]